MADKKLMTGFKVFKGTKSEFITKNYPSTHANSIVYITGGSEPKNSCIFAQGTYFGDIVELMNAINYVKGVSVNGTSYIAAAGGGYVAFGATDPSTVTVNAGTNGINIGLTTEFVNKVNNTATNLGTTSDSANASGSAFARIANLAGLVASLQGEGTGSVSEQITSAVNALRTEIVGTLGTDDSKTLAAINDELDSIISNYNTLKGRVDTIEADYLKTADITGKLDTSVYEAKVAELAKADTDNLKAAKDYTDTEIAKLNHAAVATQVETNKQAIATLNGSDTGKSVREVVQDEVTKQLESENISDSFDTLREMAEWLSSHPEDVVELQNSIKAITDDYLTSNDKEEIQNIIEENELIIAETCINLNNRISNLEDKNNIIDNALQSEDIISGSANGTISVKGSDVVVKGLASAAYTEASAYATADQGAKADAAAPQATTYTKDEVDAFWVWEEL